MAQSPYSMTATQLSGARLYATALFRLYLNGESGYEQFLGQEYAEADITRCLTSDVQILPIRT